MKGLITCGYTTQHPHYYVFPNAVNFKKYFMTSFFPFLEEWATSLIPYNCNNTNVCIEYSHTERLLHAGTRNRRLCMTGKKLAIANILILRGFQYEFKWHYFYIIDKVTLNNINLKIIYNSPFVTTRVWIFRYENGLPHLNPLHFFVLF